MLETVQPIWQIREVGLHGGCPRLAMSPPISPAAAAAGAVRGAEVAFGEMQTL